MGHHRLKAAAGASPADPYFSSTSLLLLGNGTNGGQNNTFVDGSTNNFAITRYGNTTQGTFSPFGAPDGYWSVSFDGSGDYLSVSNPSNLSFGTGAFTVEFWMNWSGATASPYMGVLGPHNGGSQLYGIFLDSSGNIGIYLGGSTFGNTLAAAVKPTPGKWMHIASCRDSSGVHRFYVDGVLKDTTTDTTNLSASGGFNIGVDCSSGRPPFSGQISNLRVLSSTALYTGSSITPSTSPLTAVSGTSLLTCQSNRFLDKSTNAATITPYGNAAVTNFAPFPTNSEYSTGTNGGSGYFDGSGDYLELPSNSAFAFGTGDFTIEMWVYLASQSTFILYDPRTTEPQLVPVIYTYNGQVRFYANGTDAITGSTLSASTWYHIALTRSGTSTKLFVNGTQSGSTFSDSNNYIQTRPIIGVYPGNLTSYFNGYISSLRILKGTAQYNANFTPSTAPLTAITNTSLLLNFTNASIIDSTGKNDLETVGDAQISTAVKKFGTGSLKFDGTGDYLAAAPNAAFQFGTGDFTVECWINKPSAANGSVVDARSGGTGATPWAFYVDGSNYPYFYDGTTYTSTVAITNNDWNHIAVVRTSGVLKIFVNGTQGYSASHSVSLNTTGSLLIGGIGAYTNGYIDDLRITKGVARYTAAFTPPSAQLPAR